MVDVENDSEILALLPARTGGKLLLTADDGRGFVANIDEITAETRKGRQVVNLKPQSKLKIVRPIPANADFVAAIGDNRKLVVFPLSELPEMARGQGWQLQRYRDGGLADALRREERGVGNKGVSK